MDKIKSNLINSIQNKQMVLYQVQFKKLRNTVDNLLDDYKESLTHIIRSQMGVGMESSVINRNYIQGLADQIQGALETMLKSWFTDVYNYELRSATSIEKLDKAEEDEFKNGIDSLKKGIHIKSINPDVRNLKQIQQRYSRAMDEILDRFEAIGVSSMYHHRGTIDENIEYLFNRVKKEYTKAIETLGALINKEYEAAITASVTPIKNSKKEKNVQEANPQKEKTVLNAANFPSELLPNIQRILAMSGYKLIRKNDDFYAVDMNGKEEKIIFYFNHNCFGLESKGSDEYYRIDTIWKMKNQPETNPLDQFLGQGRTISFDRTKKSLYTRDKATDTSFIIQLKDNEIVVKRIKGDFRETLALADALPEINLLHPGLYEIFLEEFKDEIKLQADSEKQALTDEIAELEKQELEIKKKLEEKRANLQNLNGSVPLEEFRIAKEIQRQEDLEFVAQTSKKNGETIGTGSV